MTLYDVHGNYLVGGQLPLATRKGRQIPNDRRAEQHPERLRVAKEMWETAHPSAQARSLTGVYNCMGMVFATRRTWIDPDELKMILEDDEYRQLSPNEHVVPGDIVVYKDGSGAVSHVGIVSEIRVDLAIAKREVRVLSQWGRDGEYFHRVNDVPQGLGSPSEFWTDRRGLEAGSS